MSNGLKLSPPWITFYREVSAMFKNDNDVKVVFDNDKKMVSLYVEDPVKADAISQIIVGQKEFGDTTVLTRVIPANNNTVEAGEEDLPLFQAAFKGNSALSYTTEDQKGLFDIAYIVFAPEVVQFFNDDLTDIHGLESTLYHNIAYDIFDPSLKVSYCLDAVSKGNVGMPLGEWP